MINSFNANIATKYGINIAIFIQQLSQWTFLNLANKKHLYDGLCWSYNTLEAYGDIFPYWSKKQLEKIINDSIKAGLVAKGNYNKNSYDRTCWYALTAQSYCHYDELLNEKYLTALYLCISPPGEMDFSSWRNGFLLQGTTIPTNITTKITTNNPIVPKRDVSVEKISITPKPIPQPQPQSQTAIDHFEEFWRIYPNKKGKKPCKDRWRRKNLDDIAPMILEKLNLQITNDESWKNGYVPNPLTYLNQERWEDEITKPMKASNSPSKGNSGYAMPPMITKQKSLQLEQAAAQRKQEEIAQCRTTNPIAKDAWSKLLRDISVNGSNRSQEERSPNN